MTNTQTASEIEQFIHYKAEETRNRIFVQPKDASDSTRNTQKLATLISALANTEGGEIFIGLKMSRKKVCDYYPVPNHFTEEWLFMVVNSHISPEIGNLTLSHILCHENDVVCISVPMSNIAPHRCWDKNYYLRERSEIRCLEEYDIRQLYLKKNTPLIDVWAVQNTGGIPQLSNGKYTIVNFYPRIHIKNVGNRAERMYKIELSIPTALNNNNFDVLQQHFSHFTDGYSVYSFANRHPLFPNELAQIFECNFFVNADNYKYFEKGQLRLKVYYSEGYHEKSFPLTELLVYRNEKIHINDFAEANLIDS